MPHIEADCQELDDPVSFFSIQLMTRRPNVFHSSSTLGIREYYSLARELMSLLNKVHNIELAERSWLILLYRYLSKFYMAINVDTRVGMPSSLPCDDKDVVLSHHSADNIVSLPGYPLKCSYVPTCSWINRKIISSRLGLTKNQHKCFVSGFHNVEYMCKFFGDNPVHLGALDQGIRYTTRAQARSDLLSAAAKSSNPYIYQIACWLPFQYVEQFSSRYASIPLLFPEQCSFYASFLPFASHRFLIAKYTSYGGKLFIFQHTHGYGEVEDLGGDTIESVLFYFFEEKFADSLYTWGWSNGGCTIPFRPLRLQPLIKQIASRICCDTKYDVNRLVYVVCDDAYPCNLAKTTMRQEIFFQHLNRQFAELILRTRSSKGGDYVKQVTSVARELGIILDIGGQPLHSYLTHHDVVILDRYPSTTFIECFLLNVPVVCIEPDDLVYTMAFRPFMMFFKSCGLVHPSAREAADFVSTANLSEWWRNVRSSQRMQDYLNIFCALY